MSSATPKNAGMVAERAGRFYLPELDVLRFFAFFAVFIFHLPEPFALKFFDQPGLLGTFGRAGAFGVDLFFALSGYLITGLLLRERERSGDINMPAFYARRTLRIWPLYYFSIGLAFLLTRLPESITSAPQFAHPLFLPMKPSAYFFMALFLFNFNFESSLMTNPLPFMGLLWTISVEEQFYLFWPWVVRYVPRKRIVVIPILMIAVACIVRATLTFNLLRLVWSFTFSRLDPIAVGILIALLPAFNPRPALRLLMVMIGIASWGFAAGWCGLPYQNDTLLISMGFPAVALGSGAFVLATIGASGLRRDTALLRGLSYLGKISYGLYVYSAITYFATAIVVFKLLMPAASVSVMTFSIYVLLALVFNLGAAAASYRWLETPFLKLKERFTRIPSRTI